jgi:regulator of cell morphogenesis and NO signaling
METLTQKTVGEYVKDDYRTAQVFQEFGIDFCCKGGKTLEEACKNKNIDKSKLLDAIDKITATADASASEFDHWPIDLLADYIEKRHHRYVAQTTPVLLQYLDKLCDVHGSNHPELFRIRDLFRASAGELAMHMKKEELILFPAVRKLVANPEATTATGVSGPISVMLKEHETEGDRFREIATLSNNYTPPSDGCTTYRVAFKTLEEFERDLHFHIHLENNILFPKAQALEQGM